LILTVFRIRSFRFQMPADLLTSWAFEMETLILGWYVMVNTGSVLLLTAFASLQYVGSLAAPMFGVLGDRLGGRLMLCVMRGTYAAFAAFLMLLAFTATLTPVWVFVIAGLAGIVRTNDLVMRNWLIGETIPSPQLTGALGMSRAAMDSARVAGALTGAGLSTVLGLGPAYAVVTVIYLASLALTFGVSRSRPVSDPAGAPSTASFGVQPSSHWRELKEGVRHVLKRPELIAVLWLAFLINLTAYPASTGLLPYVARKVFLVDATGLGWLSASFSLGGLVASLTMVMTGGSTRPARSMLIHSAIWYVLMLGFGFVRSLETGLLTLFLAGFVQNLAMISMTAFLLAAAGDRFRGRVMGVRMLAVYGLPLGLMAAGALIERIGYSLTISSFAALGLVLTLLIGITWRASLWRRQSQPAGAIPKPQRV
jgi:predicted MFS family arabinose efflux permease